MRLTDRRVTAAAVADGFAIMGLQDGALHEYPRAAFLGLIHPEETARIGYPTQMALSVYRQRRPSALRSDPAVLVVIRDEGDSWLLTLAVVEYDLALALAVSTPGYNGERVVLSTRTGATVIAEPSEVTTE